MPTLTNVRAISSVSGSVNNVYEMNDDFRQTLLYPEDNVLRQVNKTDPSFNTSLYGDELWLWFFKPYFTRFYPTTPTTTLQDEW